MFYIKPRKKTYRGRRLSIYSVLIFIRLQVSWCTIQIIFGVLKVNNSKSNCCAYASENTVNNNTTE